MNPSPLEFIACLVQEYKSPISTNKDCTAILVQDDDAFRYTVETFNLISLVEVKVLSDKWKPNETSQVSIKLENITFFVHFYFPEDKDNFLSKIF
jgi:hypothetical protein